MSLRDLVIEKETVTYRSVSFEVQGLSIQDIVALMKKHEAQVRELFSGEETDNKSLADLVAEAPAFVADLIARAAGEPDQADKTLTLPAGVQLEALIKIWGLTELKASDLGNVLTAVLRGVNRVSTLLNTSADGNTSNESVAERAKRLQAEGMTLPQ